MLKKILLALFLHSIILSSCSRESWKPENTVLGYIEYYDILHYDHANNTDVYLYNLDQQIIQQTTTNRKGEYEFDVPRDVKQRKISTRNFYMSKRIHE